ncbi:molybdate ABC transporter substrate-binding protein [Nocardioides insulae]|uniref:molybdate ABC transporter substrate-binding protein n=1 Tax=Nocardioides insulae TaxID=394734 RepID=UPI0004279DDA|nr:molybdate ABC transporter substrate-binding protein [Nocardioides insulae]
MRARTAPRSARHTSPRGGPALAGLAVLGVLATSLTGCGGEENEDTTLTVFAAASLQDTFTEIADEFEAEHADVDVRLNFDGSSGLAEQIQGGAPADVFASADTQTMDTLVADDLVESPEPFATNTLEIAVPPDNPAGIATFADLAGPDVRLVICAPEVPCGHATAQVASDAGVTLAPVSEEQSVTDVLGKVTTGEADAGLVYVTDVTAAGEDVQGIPFEESKDVVNTYPIAPVTDSEHGDLAAEFVTMVRSDAGRQVLTEAGFGTP